MAASYSATSDTRSWRTAFLTVRDETQQFNCFSESSKSLGELLTGAIFSQLNSLITASSHLPSQEVTSDIVFLLELVGSCQWTGPDIVPVFSGISLLMHDICRVQRMPLQLNSSSWIVVLDSLAYMLQLFLNKSTIESITPAKSEAFSPVTRCLETLRHLTTSRTQMFSLADDVQLGKFLLNIVDYYNAQFLDNLYTRQRYSVPLKVISNQDCGLWESKALVYRMLKESLERMGSSLPVELWHRTIEVLRKVMEGLLSTGVLAEDRTMSRYFVALLNCLHCAIADPKGSLKEHVSSFVTTLRMFFLYGHTHRQNLDHISTNHQEKNVAKTTTFISDKGMEKHTKPYRPPHMRRKDKSNCYQNEIPDLSTSSDGEYPVRDVASSDSDCSDCDGVLKDVDGALFSKVRACAIVCIQDLCHVDPKSFTNQWMILLPTNDVLQPRRAEATLMTCLLHDPFVKVQIASALALTVMLDRPASVSLQVAEYNESAKWSSFMPLSSSLGCMLWQLHRGVLYMIQRERNLRLLTYLFKILGLLISHTPYARMPGDLLPTVITSILTKIDNDYTLRNDLSALISCLGAAMSTAPSSLQVKNVLLSEIATGVPLNRNKSVFFTLLHYSEQFSRPSTCAEALQALKAMVHNYPTVARHCCERVTLTVSNLLSAASSGIAQPRKEDVNDSIIEERVIILAIKVLDECLRALSGFKGTEDLSDDKLIDTPFVCESTRAKKVSSAPSFECESLERSDAESHLLELAKVSWSQMIEHLLPQLLQHQSAMVRTASVTCFAGMTSSVFYFMSQNKQEFLIYSLLSAADHDVVPMVRSAACRAIGVISFFPHFPWSAGLFGKIFSAIKNNVHDPLVSVRITASWALANLCESIRHYIEESQDWECEITCALAECALYLTRDGDKIKSNAVRALGNLSRYLKQTSSSSSPETPPNSATSMAKQLQSTSSSQSYGPETSYNSSVPRLLDKIVQAFLSCVTSGNVKVQWNVCHALGNLFLNNAVRLQEMEWAPSLFSVLLLLLRDSSNFKIKIQAACALAVPSSMIDYGKSFSDVVHVLVHVLENINAIQISDPSGFKYRIALENQITSTVLHLLTLVSAGDHYPWKDFLLKKAVFLEDWFKTIICTSLAEATRMPEADECPQNQKKLMVSSALCNLVHFFTENGHLSVAQKFQQLVTTI